METNVPSREPCCLNTAPETTVTFTSLHSSVNDGNKFQLIVSHFNQWAFPLLEEWEETKNSFVQERPQLIRQKCLTLTDVIKIQFQATKIRPFLKQNIWMHCQLKKVKYNNCYSRHHIHFSHLKTLLVKKRRRSHLTQFIWHGHSLPSAK